MLRKVAFLEVLRSPLFKGVAGSLCKATKNELLTKFLKGALKVSENFQEVFSTGAPYQKFTDL